LEQASVCSISQNANVLMDVTAWYWAFLILGVDFVKYNFDNLWHLHGNALSDSYGAYEREEVPLNS
jgi:hypothetical protein